MKRTPCNAHSPTFALLALLASACGAPADLESLGESAAPIIGGTPDNGDPAVVLLISYPQDQSTFSTCTASVIAPTVLLTAAHCVDAPNHPGFSFGAFLGPDASSYGSVAEIAADLVPASEAIAHPDYDASAADYPADIAVVLLASPVGVAPLPFNHTPLGLDIQAKPARLIGYGQTAYGQYNATKYATTTTVFYLDDDGHTVAVGDDYNHTCVGDSGGPALVKKNGKETIIGVDSFTTTTGCTEAAHFQRVDVYWDFVKSHIPASGTGGSSAGAGENGSAVAASSSASAGVGGGDGGWSGWVPEEDAVEGELEDAPMSRGCTASPAPPGSAGVWLIGLLMLLRRFRPSTEPHRFMAGCRDRRPCRTRPDSSRRGTDRSRHTDWRRPGAADCSPSRTPRRHSGSTVGSSPPMQSTRGPGCRRLARACRGPRRARSRSRPHRC